MYESNAVADKNYKNLNIENERVNKNLRNCFNCWIYLMVAVVFTVFIMMVLFMKIYSKKKYTYADEAASIARNKIVEDSVSKPFSSYVDLNNSSLNTPYKNEL